MRLQPSSMNRAASAPMRPEATEALLAWASGANPTGVHAAARAAKAALEAGKHVFVEKPMAETAAQAEELIALAARKKLTLMVDHTFIYTGAVRKMPTISEASSDWVCI